jgi:hypothetical protein
MELLDFTMNNRDSALAGPALTTLVENAWWPGDGRCAVRRGITTTTTFTINLTVGTTAPFTIIVWQVGTATRYIACGANALAFINPRNNYLYTRTADAAVIYSDYNTTPGTIVSSTWGLDAPSVSVTKLDLETSTVGGAFAPGFYACALSNWDETRQCESPATIATCEKLGSGVPSYETSKLQIVKTIQWGIGWPAHGSIGSHARYYRARVLNADSLGSRLPEAVGSIWHLRMVNQLASGAFSDDGTLPDGQVLSYATDVVPFYKSIATFDGMYIYALGNATADAYKFIWTRQGCPEIYCGSFKSILADLGNQVVRGIAEGFVPTTCGTVTAVADLGGQTLILCQRGSFQIIRSEVPGCLSVNPDNLYVGCVSRQTIANSPYGLWWLSSEGVVLWQPGGQPRVVTAGIIDPDHADTDFAADLTSACGAFDVKNGHYVVRIPKDDGTQFALCVKPNFGETGVGLHVSKWTFGSTVPAITGMGWNWVTQQLMFCYGTTPTCYAQSETAYRDSNAAGTLSSYNHVLEIVWGGQVKARGDDLQNKHGVKVTVHAHRLDTTTAQTMSLSLRGMMSTLQSVGDTKTGLTLTWDAGDVDPQTISPQGLDGRMFEATLTQATGAVAPMEIRSIQIGTPTDEVPEEGVR